MRRYLLGVFFLLSGCSLFHDSYVERFGDSVLRTVGLDSADGDVAVPGGVEVRDGLELTREEEYYLGRAVSARVLAANEAESDEALQSYVENVGHAVALYSDLPETFGGYHFMVLKSDEVNALSGPGGFVFVSSGLLKLLNNEEELAAVLAHEVAHVARHHGALAISREHQESTLNALGQIRGSINCTEALIQISALFAGAVDDIYTALTKSGYSRDQEFEADSDAREILRRAGYEPDALARTLTAIEDLKRRGEGAEKSKTGWFSTHPDPADRLSKLGNSVVAVAHSRAFGKRLARFDAALKR